MDHNLSNLTSIVVTIGLMVCLLADLCKGFYRIVSGRTVVLASVFLWYLLEALRSPRDLGQYKQDEYDFGMFCVALAVALFLVAYHTSRMALFGPLARRLTMLDQPRVLWLLVMGGMTIGVGSLLLYSGFDVPALFEGLTGMRARWSDSIGRGRYGSWSTVLYELQMFLVATIPLAGALIFMKRAPVGRRWIAGVFLAWMTLRTFFSGTRGPLLPILLTVGAAVFWSASREARRKLLFVGVPIVALAGYYWSAAVVAGRNAGRLDVNATENVDYVGFEMFRELLFVSRAAERDLPLQWGYTYFTQMVNPIPRAIWPEKPVADAGLILARAYGAVDRNGEPTMTVSPGFLGEAYLNFGFLGVLIIPAVAGVVVRAWDNLLPLAKRSLPIFLVYAGGLATIVLSGRSFNFSNYYGLLALFVLMLAFEKVGINVSRRRVRALTRTGKHRRGLRVHAVVVRTSAETRSQQQAQ